MLDHFVTGDRYHYMRLAPHEKKLYDKIFKQLQLHNNNFTIPLEKHNGVYPTGERMLDIMLHIIWDNPSLYYFDGTNMVCYHHRSSSGESYQVTYTEHFPASLRPQVEQALLMRADAILSLAREHAPGHAQLYFLYRYLVKNIVYMHSINTDNSLKNLEARTVVGPLLSHLCVCAGYTKAFKLLCDQLNIPCFYIRGQGLGDNGWGNHGWNIVYLDGAFYHVDITFDSGTYMSTGKNKCAYFLRNDEFMLKDHRWDRSRFPLIVDNYL